MKANVETMIITPGLALELLKSNTRNRRMNKELVTVYADQMTLEQWRFNGESIIISKSNVLLDGQHRLAAIVKSGKSQQMVVVSGVADDAFDTIDTGRLRSAGDVLSIAGVPNDSQISSLIMKRHFVKIQIPGVYHNRKKSMTRAEVLSEYKTSPEFYQSALKVARGLNKKVKLLPIASIGGYIAHLVKDRKYDEQYVLRFFKQLFMEDVEENETISTLRNLLINNMASKKKMRATYIDAVIAKAWNSYVSGRVLRRLVYSENETKPTFI